MERLRKRGEKKTKIQTAKSVEDALKKHRSGVEQVVLNDVTPPEQQSMPAASETKRSSDSHEYIGDEVVQTIPDHNHPIADEMVEWLLNGGPPPIEHAAIPDHLRAPEFTDEGEIVFPGVVANLDEHVQEEETGESNTNLKKPSILRRADEKALSLFSQLVRKRIGHEYYSGD